MARKGWLVPLTVEQLEAYKAALYSEIAAVTAEVELKKVLNEEEPPELEPSSQLRLPWNLD